MLFFRTFRSTPVIHLGVLILALGLSLLAPLESREKDKSGNKDRVSSNTLKQSNHLSEKYREIWQQSFIQSAKNAGIDVGDLLESGTINLEPGSTLTSEDYGLLPMEIQAVCGNGIVEFPERCEPPNTNFCNEFCQWNPETTITKTIPLVCSNSSTADLLQVSYELTAIPQGDVREGQEVTIQFAGVGNFSSDLLNGALDMFPNLDELRADAMKATAVVRSGATGGGPVVLNPDLPEPLPQIFPIIVENGSALPISIPLTLGSATFTPVSAGTDILVGWDESYLPPNEPAWTVNNPPGPNGARASIWTILWWTKMGLECYMARLNGGVAVPLDDSELLAIPVESLTGVDDHLPSQLVLSSYPNPFNPMTTVSYTVPESGNVKLDVYDARGALVKNLVNEYREAGAYTISWNGTDRNGKKMPSGVYFLKIGSKAGSKSSKIVMVR